MSGGRGNCGEKVGNGEKKDCRLFRLVPNFFFFFLSEILLFLNDRSTLVSPYFFLSSFFFLHYERVKTRLERVKRCYFTRTPMSKWKATPIFSSIVEIIMVFRGTRAHKCNFPVSFTRC